MSRAAGWGAIAAVLAACGSSTPAPAPAPVPAPAPAPAPTPAPGVDCTHDPTTFPSFAKTCATDADCALAFRRVDCCYGQTAIGIAKSESARFDAAKATCDDQWTARNCPSCVTRPPTSIEDGSSSMQDDPIAVQCRAGKCTSVLPTHP